MRCENGVLERVVGGELLVDALTGLEHGVEVAARVGVKVAVDFVLEHVLGEARKDGHFGGYIKNGAASLQFFIVLQSVLLCGRRLHNRLGDGVGLLLGLQRDEKRAVVRKGSSLEVVDEVRGDVILGAFVDGERVLLEAFLEPRAVLAKDRDGVGLAVKGDDGRGKLVKHARRREGRAQVRVGAEEGSDECGLRRHLGVLRCSVGAGFSSANFVNFL